MEVVSKEEALAAILRYGQKAGPCKHYATPAQVNRGAVFYARRKDDKGPITELACANCATSETPELLLST